jgi:hypothetical protein
MFTRMTAAAACSVLALACVAPQNDSQEIIDNLVKAGYPASDIAVVGGIVYVGGDAEVSLQASREMLGSGDSTEEQYRTDNLIHAGITKICINGSTFTGAFSTALDMAIANYEEQPLKFSMARTPSAGCSFTINAVIAPGVTGGSSGFPAGGLPFATINIGDGLTTFPLSTLQHVITHEIGHTIGLRHTDFFNRSISCGTGGDEGPGTVGVIHIPGTPTGAVVGGSIMNACFRREEVGEFTASDVTALVALYGHRFVRGLTAWDQPEGGWTGFTLNVADVSGDRRADLIWNSVGARNRTYVALSNGTGTFTRALTAWDQPEGGWTGFTLNVADVSGDGRADLVWSFLGAHNRTYVALSNGDGTFRRALTAWDQPEASWTGYTLNVVDVSGDRRADLVWNLLGAGNRTYVALSNGDGTFRRALTAWDQPETSWTGFTLKVADVSGDGRADLVWNRLGAGNRTYVALSNGTGTFTRALTAWDQPEPNWTDYAINLADVSGDGRADLVWSSVGAGNRTYVAWANGDGTFRRTLTSWDQPEGGWTGFTLHVADITGDGRSDLLWNFRGAFNRTYDVFSSP